MLTGALEDYLETVYELVRDKKLARIKDIAKARGVKSGSVSPAMRRLSDMGLVNYMEREYIDLTPKGETLARRIYAKHKVLTRFFAGVLRMPKAAAVENACAMEHSLSDEGMDHLVRFFEFLEGCPEGAKFLQQFHRCARVHPNQTSCSRPCDREPTPGSNREEAASLSGLLPGQSGRVSQIVGDADMRQALFDKGIVPNAVVAVARAATEEGGVVITLEGFELALSSKEAEAVRVLFGTDSLQ